VQEHHKFFFANPMATCRSFMAELKSLDAFGVKVFFSGEALVKFEEIKRLGSPHAKGKDKLKNANFKLPIIGAPIEWQDF
jgi:hypothetical protein